MKGCEHVTSGGCACLNIKLHFQSNWLLVPSWLWISPFTLSAKGLCDRHNIIIKRWQSRGSTLCYCRGLSPPEAKVQAMVESTSENGFSNPMLATISFYHGYLCIPWHGHQFPIKHGPGLEWKEQCQMELRYIGTTMGRTLPITCSHCACVAEDTLLSL